MDPTLTHAALGQVELECLAACCSLVAGARHIVGADSKEAEEASKETKEAAGRGGKGLAREGREKEKEGVKEAAREGKEKERIVRAREECREALKLLLECREFVSSVKPVAPTAAAGGGAQAVLDMAYALACADVALLLKMYSTFGVKEQVCVGARARVFVHVQICYIACIHEYICCICHDETIVTLTLTYTSINM